MNSERAIASGVYNQMIVIVHCSDSFRFPSEVNVGVGISILYIKYLTYKQSISTVGGNWRRTVYVWHVIVLIRWHVVIIRTVKLEREGSGTRVCRRIIFRKT